MASCEPSITLKQWIENKMSLPLADTEAAIGRVVAVLPDGTFITEEVGGES